MTCNTHIATEAGSSSDATSPTTRQGSARLSGSTAGLIGFGLSASRRREANTMNLTPASRGHHGPRMRVSRLTVSVLAAAFLIGVAEGAVAYSHRSSALKQHVPGTNAITIHVVLAIAAAGVVIAIQVRRSRQQGRPGPSPWSAPFSGHAVARLGRTVRQSRGAAVTRQLPIAPLILVLLYCPWRIGAEITGGLDPNSVVNAWGGPTYAGALLAHSLDSIVGFYVVAFLLGRLLVATKPREMP
jgi:hypothetical protein